MSICEGSEGEGVSRLLDSNRGYRYCFPEPWVTDPGLLSGLEPLIPLVGAIDPPCLLRGGGGEGIFRTWCFPIFILTLINLLTLLLSKILIILPYFVTAKNSSGTIWVVISLLITKLYFNCHVDSLISNISPSLGLTKYTTSSATSLDSLFKSRLEYCSAPSTSCQRRFQHHAKGAFNIMPKAPSTSCQRRLQLYAKGAFNIMPKAPSTSCQRRLQLYAKGAFNIMPKAPSTSCQRRLQHHAKGAFNFMPKAPSTSCQRRLQHHVKGAFNFMPKAPSTSCYRPGSLHGADESSIPRDSLSLEPSNVASCVSKGKSEHSPEPATRQLANVSTCMFAYLIKEVTEQSPLQQARVLVSAVAGRKYGCQPIRYCAGIPVSWALKELSRLVIGRTCAVRLLASHTVEPGSIPSQAAPDFRLWESCRMMPLVGGFSRYVERFPPPMHSCAAPCPMHCLNLWYPLYLCRAYFSEPVYSVVCVPWYHWQPLIDESQIRCLAAGTLKTTPADSLLSTVPTINIFQAQPTLDHGHGEWTDRQPQPLAITSSWRRRGGGGGGRQPGRGRGKDDIRCPEYKWCLVLQSIRGRSGAWDAGFMGSPALKLGHHLKSQSYAQHDEDTARLARALRLEAIAHLMHVSL
ncbi:hypothetical protein PR048_021075 [Dryococelus australis]|uniref:Uncharacterized protein n=1 Tax=Dryococelus australis TaxID=614101 RepID=A0ABQ9GX69_9NEOP|nr:hypothetical protein PR048_021075 [Dryococelus australis]